MIDKYGKNNAAGRHYRHLFWCRFGRLHFIHFGSGWVARVLVLQVPPHSVVYVNL